MPAPRTTGSIEWVGDPENPKPTDHWRCRITVDGKRPWMKLPPTIRHTQRAKAIRAAHGLAARARAGLVPDLVPKPRPVAPVGETLAAWAVRWFEARERRGLKSVRADRARWATWVEPRLGALPVAAITRADVEAWVEWVDEQVQSEALAWKTATCAWSLLTTALRDAAHGKVKALRARLDNPAADVEGPERGAARSKPYLYPDEFLRLAGCDRVALAERRAYAVTVYLYPRAGEVEALEWGDLDLGHGTVLIHRAVDAESGEVRETKGKATRRFEVEPELVPLLRAMRAERPLDRLVFDPWPLHKDRAGQLRRNLLTAGVARVDLFADDATRKQMTFHDLRATGTTWAAIRGDEPLRIMHRAGHKDLATTMAYVREGENVRGGFGTVFPPLPPSLLGIDPRTSQGTSRGNHGSRGTAVKEASRAVRGEGIELSGGGAPPPEGPGNPSPEPRPQGRTAGPRGASSSHGTIDGTMVERRVRDALDAALAAGDLTTAQGLLDLLKSAQAPGAAVIPLAARRRGAR